MCELRKQWDEEGYVAVEGVFDTARVDELRRICDDVLAQFLQCCPEKKRPGGAG